MKYFYPFLALLFIGCKNSTPVDFEWKFDQGKTYTYAYNQVSNNKISGLSEDESTALLKLTMELVGESDSLAMLTFTEATIEIDGNTENLPQAPGMAMTSKGKFDENASNALFSMLMILPKNNLKEDESETIAFEVPFYTSTAVYTSTGTNELTFKEVVDYNGHQCALLESVIAYDDPEFAEGTEGLANNGTGSGSYYFDIERRIFLKNQIEIEMSTSYDVNTQTAVSTKIEFELVEE